MSPGFQPKFEPVTDELEIRRLIERAAETTAKADVNFSEVRIQFQTQVTEHSSAQAGIEVRIPDEFRGRLQHLVKSAPEVLLILYLRNQALLGVSTRSIDWEDETFRIRPPFRVLRMQRRKEARFQIPVGYDIFVGMNAIEGESRRVQKRVLDISASGMGLQVISPREAGFFQQGLMLRNLRFELEGRKITVDAEVCNRVPLNEAVTGHSGTKVGLRFTKISRADQDFLAAFVTRRLAQMVI